MIYLFFDKEVAWMAREFTLAGVDQDEIKNAPPPERPPRDFFDILSDFWYHHKPLILLGGFLLFVALWLLISTLADNPPDYRVVVVTERPFAAKEREALEAYLAQGGVDIDGDGKVEVLVDSLSPNYYDELAPTVGRADNDKLQSHLVTGEIMLFVFDKEGYEGFGQTLDNVFDGEYEFFAPIKTSSAMYNAEEHYWNWKGDKRIAAFGMASFPEELYFCVRYPGGTAGGENSKKLSAEGVALLEKLIATAKQ